MCASSLRDLAFRSVFGINPEADLLDHGSFDVLATFTEIELTPSTALSVRCTASITT